jgi:hypothetical protein
MKKKVNEVLKLKNKKPWQVSRGHRVVKQTGGIHADKRVDEPGKGGRKQDQFRKLMDD